MKLPVTMLTIYGPAQVPFTAPAPGRYASVLGLHTSELALDHIFTGAIS